MSFQGSTAGLFEKEPDATRVAPTATVLALASEEEGSAGTEIGFAAAFSRDRTKSLSKSGTLSNF
jgi:hypothetical protein